MLDAVLISFEWTWLIDTEFENCYFSSRLDSPQIEISVTRSPANTLPNGTSVNLTCKVWQKDDMAMKSSNSNLRPNGIEWFNPQDRQVKECGRTESQAASVLKCTLMVGVLTKDKLGIYTCKTSNPYYYCWTRKIQVDAFQGKWEKTNKLLPFNELGINISIWATAHLPLP